MLVIRKDQVQALHASALSGFENEMVPHLEKFSPPLFKAAGEEHIRKAIRLGISRAESYGFTNRGPVRMYLETMLLFGSDFDTDPQYPWFAEILENQGLGSQMSRAELLYERILDYRAHVAGPEDRYALDALRNIQSLAKRQIEPVSDPVAAMMKEADRIYPQKAAYSGPEILEALIREGAAAARKYGFSGMRETALVIILMLAFGHGFGSDPLYPWIERTLKNEALGSPSERAKRLETRAVIWLDHVLKYFEGQER